MFLAWHINRFFKNLFICFTYLSFWKKKTLKRTSGTFILGGGLGSSAELLDNIPSYPNDWIKKLVIWGLEYRQQGAMVLNVRSGPGLLAGDGRMCWAGQSEWQYLITPGIDITNFTSGLPF